MTTVEIDEATRAPGPRRSRVIELPGVVRPMLYLAIPVLVEQLLSTLVGFVDTWLTGHYVPGEAPMAAIGLMAYMMWLIPSMFASVGIGATALVARFVGDADFTLAHRVTHQALLVGLLFAVALLGILALLGDKFVWLLNLRGEAGELGERYLQYIVPAIPAIMIVQIGVACLRGAGDTFSGFLAMGAVNLVNLLVGATLTIGIGPAPRLGWDGLAIGTVSGYVTGACVVLLILAGGRAHLGLRAADFVPDVTLIRRLLRVGLPGGLDVAAILGCHLWFVRIINGMGTLAASAHMLAIRIEAISYLPGTAFQVAAGTMAGQYLGAGDRRRASRGVIAACIAGNVVLIAAGLLFFFGAEALTTFFVGSADNPTARATVPLLQLAAFSMPPLAMSMVLAGALRGAGDTRWPLLITLIGFLGVRIPARWLSRPDS